MEGLIFGGVYLRREMCVSKSIGLALKFEGNLPFLLCFTLHLRAISKDKPPGGAYIWRGDLMEGFLRYEFGGLTHGGAYFRNVTIFIISLRLTWCAGREFLHLAGRTVEYAPQN